jgi:hypothetical protein
MWCLVDKSIPKPRSADEQSRFIYDEISDFAAGIDNGYYRLSVVGDSIVIHNRFLEITNRYPYMPWSGIGPIVYGRLLSEAGFTTLITVSPMVKDRRARIALRLAFKFFKRLKTRNLIITSKRWVT